MLGLAAKRTDAQHAGPHGSGGGHSYAPRPGPYHHPGPGPYRYGYRPYGYWGPHYHGFYRPYYPYALGVGVGIGLGYGVYGAYAPYNAYPYGPPPVMVYSQPAYDPGPPPAAPQAGGQNAPAPDNAAHLQLQVPENAEVWFQGVRTTQTGRLREFNSAPLTPGMSYSYKISVRYTDAKGTPVNDTRDIQVRANDWFSIDFTQPPPTAPPNGSY